MGEAANVRKSRMLLEAPAFVSSMIVQWYPARTRRTMMCGVGRRKLGGLSKPLVADVCKVLQACRPMSLIDKGWLCCWALSRRQHDAGALYKSHM